MEGTRLGCPPTFSNEKRLTMDYAEAKAKIVEGLTKKLKTKSKFYFNDLSDILEMKPRSTSMYGLKGTGKQAAAEHEE